MSTQTQENPKAVKALHELLLSGKSYDSDSLKAIGINLELEKQEIGNLRITYGFWEGLDVKLIDRDCDLLGNSIKENKKLIARIKYLYESGECKLKIGELSAINIWKPSRELIFGNLRLKNNYDFLSLNDYYDIELVDEEKDLNGLWKDDSITTNRVIDVLHKFDYTVEQLSTLKEVALNKELETHFKKYFKTVKKGARSDQGDIDLLLGSHNYAIELKLAREITKASNRQKAIGQVMEYVERYKNNLLLVIAGSKEDRSDKSVEELMKKATAHNCSYFYLEAE